MERRPHPRLTIFLLVIVFLFFLTTVYFARHFPLDGSGTDFIQSFISALWHVGGNPGLLLATLIFPLLIFEKLVKNPPVHNIQIKHFLGLYVIGVPAHDLFYYYYAPHYGYCPDGYCILWLFIFPIVAIPMYFVLSWLRFFVAKKQEENRYQGLAQMVQLRFRRVTPYLFVVFILLGITILMLVVVDYSTQGRYLGMSPEQLPYGNEPALEREAVRNNFARYCSILEQGNRDACRKIYEKNCSTILYSEIYKCKENFFREVIPSLYFEKKVETKISPEVYYYNCPDVSFLYSGGTKCTREDYYETNTNGLLVLEFKSDNFDATSQEWVQQDFNNEELFDFLSRYKDFRYDIHTRGQHEMAYSIFVPIEVLFDDNGEIYREIRRFISQQEQFLTQTFRSTK